MWALKEGACALPLGQPGRSHQVLYLLAKGGPAAFDEQVLFDPLLSRSRLSSVWQFSEPAVLRGLSPMVARRAMLLTTPAEGLVLDPFAGDFSVAVAAQLLARRFVGIELSQKRCQRASARLSGSSSPSSPTSRRRPLEAGR